MSAYGPAHQYLSLTIVVCCLTSACSTAGAELHEAIASWQARHHLAAVLSTGFLDGSHPIVDVYELGVRLQHMLRRLTALAAGAMVQAPICVMPGVFVGNAVAADSHHLLQYLGVTHVVNAAQVRPAWLHKLSLACSLLQAGRVLSLDVLICRLIYTYSAAAAACVAAPVTPAACKIMCPGQLTVPSTECREALKRKDVNRLDAKATCCFCCISRSFKLRRPQVCSRSTVWPSGMRRRKMCRDTFTK